MMRVLRPQGSLAVAVWDSLAATPGYAAMTDPLQRLFGERAADALRAPFVLGDVRTLSGLFSEAGVADVRIATHTGVARFPSLHAWVRTDVKGWTLADMLDDVQYALLQNEAQKTLQRFVTTDGIVAFPAPAHIAVAVNA